MPHNRSALTLLICGLLVSVGCIMPGRADAAALVRNCTPATINQVRTLASARVPQVHRLCAQAHKSATVVRFYHRRGRWAVAPRYATVQQVPGPKWRKVVRKNRAILQYHQRRLTKLEGKIKRLVTPALERGYLPPPQARALGRQMAAAQGWTGAQWNCLDTLWGTKGGKTLESGWDVHADNPTSPAAGIPQADPGSKMASAGPGWWESAYVQIKWGLGYIKEKFETPCKALTYRLVNGSY